MVRKRKKVETFEYPVKAKSPSADIFSFRMLFKPLPILWLFHVSMVIQLLTGLIMAIISPWVDTLIVRQIHGYAGAFFAFMYVLYLGMIAINDDFRGLRDTINYIEIVFYGGLILFGFSFSSIFNPGNILPFLLPYATLFHTLLLTYGWMVTSLLGGGGIVQGLASIYFLIDRARTKEL